MTAITVDDAQRYFGFSKGAPEILLRLCSYIYEDGKARPLTEEDKSRILDINAKLADRALRVLALAFKPIEKEIPDWEPEQVEKNLIFVGLVGMIDPPRDEVEEAIKICKKAGIRPIMITGDHKLTARAIASTVGLIEKDGKVLTGAEIDQMTEIRSS